MRMGVIYLKIAVSCDDLGPAPRNGKKDSSNVTFGSIVSFTCNYGYHITGKGQTVKKQTMTCQSDRQWRGTKPRCSREWTLRTFAGVRNSLLNAVVFAKKWVIRLMFCRL